MFFATSILHVHLMQWYDDSSVEQAVNKCDEVWESIEPEKVSGFLPFCVLLNFMSATQLLKMKKAYLSSKIYFLF